MIPSGNGGEIGGDLTDKRACLVFGLSVTDGWEDPSARLTGCAGAGQWSHQSQSTGDASLHYSVLQYCLDRTGVSLRGLAWLASL